MSSREKIIAAIKANQPNSIDLPDITIPQSNEDLAGRFTLVATAIGSRVFQIQNTEEIKTILETIFDTSLRIVSSFAELSDIAQTNISQEDPHSLADVELAILKGDIAVAENAAIWVPENNTLQRVLPFIPQHLALVIQKDSLVPTMHQAYEKIGLNEYNYGVFIAGPSKTADIEQSLVLGAHGPRSLTIFILA